MEVALARVTGCVVTTTFTTNNSTALTCMHASAAQVVITRTALPLLLLLLLLLLSQLAKLRRLRGAQHGKVVASAVVSAESSRADMLLQSERSAPSATSAGWQASPQHPINVGGGGGGGGINTGLQAILEADRAPALSGFAGLRRRQQLQQLQQQQQQRSSSRAVAA
jgi:hypothetical protein